MIEEDDHPLGHCSTTNCSNDEEHFKNVASIISDKESISSSEVQMTTIQTLEKCGTSISVTEPSHIQPNRERIATGQSTERKITIKMSSLKNTGEQREITAHNGNDSGASEMSEVKQHKLSCNYCDFSTEVAKEFRIHLRYSHRVFGLIKCPECDYSSRYMSHLSMHIKAVHWCVKPHQCKECDYRAARLGCLKQHVRAVHKKERSHKCSTCMFKTSQISSLRRHMRFKHQVSENMLIRTKSNEPLRQQFENGVTVIEDQDTLNRNNLEENDSECVTSTEKNNSTQTQKEANNLTQKEESYQSTDDIDVSLNKNREWSCFYCQYSTKMNRGLITHLKYKHGVSGSFKCPQCDYSSRNLSHIDAHVRCVHSSLRPYRCQECHYKTALKYTLTKHIKAVHKKERPYKCPMCDHRSAQKNNMLKHLQIKHVSLSQNEIENVSLEQTTKSPVLDDITHIVNTAQ